MVARRKIDTAALNEIAQEAPNQRTPEKKPPTTKKPAARKPATAKPPPAPAKPAVPEQDPLVAFSCRLPMSVKNRLAEEKFKRGVKIEKILEIALADYFNKKQ